MKTFAFIANGEVVSTRDIPNDQPIPEGFVQYRPSDAPVAPEGSIAVRTGHVVDKDGYCTDAWVITPTFDPNAVAQPAPVPTEVPLWAFRAVLTLMGLDTKVDGLIATLSPQAKIVANTQWVFGNVIDRGHPLIAALGLEMGLSASQIDDIFFQSNALK